MQELIQFSQQHWALTSGLVAVFIALVLLELIRSKQNSWELSSTALTQLINHENAVVIDLRNQEAYAKGHIIDALSLPAHELKENPKKLEKYKSKPIVLVCGTGIDSRKIASQIKNDGYNVYTLAGGIRSWVEADMPLVKAEK